MVYRVIARATHRQNTLKKKKNLWGSKDYLWPLECAVH